MLDSTVVVAFILAGKGLLATLIIWLRSNQKALMLLIETQNEELEACHKARIESAEKIGRLEATVVHLEANIEKLKVQVETQGKLWKRPSLLGMVIPATWVTWIAKRFPL